MKSKYIAACFVLLLVFLTACSAIEQPEDNTCCGCYAAAPVDEPGVRAAAAFAVDAQQEILRAEQKNDSIQLQLVAIAHAETQVVAGMNYKLELVTTLDGKEKTAEAVVWEQLWKPVPRTLVSWDWK